MKQRCNNPNSQDYKNYGGRGITICDKWFNKKNGFINFYTWAMANGYSEDNLKSGRNKLTLDRIDNDSNYCPENCRWVTNIEQQNNKRNNVLITYNNQTHTIVEWARILNINPATLYSRLDKLHWNVEKALITKIAIGGKL